MNRITLMLLSCALIVPSVVTAQSNAEMIERTLLPLSERTAQGASVVAWKADQTWETIKEGTNTWVCYERSGDPGQAPFAVQCTSKENLLRVAQNRRFAAQGTTPEERRDLVATAQENGSRVDAEYGSLFISMNGQDQESTGIHTTVAVPYATGESTGLPESRSQGGAWVMAAGTSEAHIMVPGR
jgi:hypothetical protein